MTASLQVSALRATKNHRLWGCKSRRDTAPSTSLLAAAMMSAEAIAAGGGVLLAARNRRETLQSQECSRLWRTFNFWQRLVFLDESFFFSTTCNRLEIRVSGSRSAPSLEVELYLTKNTAAYTVHMAGGPTRHAR